MSQKIRRHCKPTTILLVIGFAISLMSMMIGISTIDKINAVLSQYEADAPISLSMENTGLALSLSIYLFSLVNCFAITNYWIITKRREMAIRKAFGWRGLDLIILIGTDLLKIICVSLMIAGALIVALANIGGDFYAINITPFFVVGTLLLLLFTLMLSMAVPMMRIAKIRPAEVIE